MKAESAVGYPMEVEEDPPAPASSSGDLPKAGIEVEAKPEKSEILEEEPRRRKVLRFGSAHIRRRPWWRGWRNWLPAGRRVVPEPYRPLKTTREAPLRPQSLIPSTT